MVSRELTLEMEKAIDAFEKDEHQTQTFTPTVKGIKYFIKVCGAERGKYRDNEVDALQCLSKISPFYANYYIGCLTRKDKTAILLKYVEGTDMYEMIRSGGKWSVSFLIKLYKILLSKIRVYHDHLMTHGDIKATNFYIHSKGDKKSKRGKVGKVGKVGKKNDVEDEDDGMDIDLIDTESVNNFNMDHRPVGKKAKFINFISTNYDFPVKLKRGKIQFRNHKNAFLFYKYLDLYSIAALILFLYKPRVYQMLKTKGEKENAWKIGKRQRRPTEFVEKQSNALEKALYYVFSFLPYVEKTGDTIEIDNIPISHRRIVELLDE